MLIRFYHVKLCIEADKLYLLEDSKKVLTMNIIAFIFGMIVILGIILIGNFQVTI